MKAGEPTISLQELAAPLQAIQSDTEPLVTSDDNIPPTVASPIVPATILRSPANIRLKKGKGKKGKSKFGSPLQSRYIVICH